MKCETLYLAVNYLDRYLAKRVVAREELQLVGITAILVASKHEELAPQSVQNLVIMTDNTYEHGEVLQTERDLLAALDYHLTVLTPLRALELLRVQTLGDARWERERVRGSHTWGSQLQTDTWVLSAFLLELALAEFQEVSERPSTLTAAAALLAVHNYEWAWRGSAEASASPREAEVERGEAGPAFSIVAAHVLEMMRPLLQPPDAEGEGEGREEARLESIGHVMWRLHGYHASVLPTFATLRKYVGPGRLGVALRPPSPSSSLPRSVTLHGVRYSLRAAAAASTN